MGLEDSQRLFMECHRPQRLAQRKSQITRPNQRSPTHCTRCTIHREYLVEPLPSLAEVAVYIPEPPQRRHQTLGKIHAALLDQSTERGAYIVMLGLHPPEPAQLVRAAQERLSVLCERNVVFGMSLPDYIRLAA